MADIKVFAMNDCDWYAAETLDDALRAMAELYCFPPTPEGIADMRKEYEVNEPSELSAEAMARMTFQEEDEDGSGAEMKSFRVKLDEMIAGGEEFPCFFASTEF
jgi:hypothetical protein